MAKDQYLAGKLAVITGAGKPNGIGAAAAYALAEHGANIVIHYGKSSAAAETVKKIETLGVKAVAISVDQESETFGQDLIQATLKDFNTETIDIIINNAPDMIQGVLMIVSNREPARFTRILNQSPSRISIGCFEPMSVGHFIGAGCHPISCFARRSHRKHRQHHRSERLSSWQRVFRDQGTIALGWGEQLGPKRIVVNTVVPGPIKTDMVFPEDHPMTQKFRFEYHINRNGTPMEVAETILFLASPMAAYVTGQQVCVDGGLIYP
ncbi:hypothetical protein Egran_03971 [Elaphomyces granulatus]|uniref:Uncharacterized protein n=1 Tax=Elaphomyces granulatus TaxID=519963 RepID=A0A232LVT4_9EURO|nr:hypothetical protein Egran_03971 [Elaphomyces granulatus]